MGFSILSHNYIEAKLIFESSSRLYRIKKANLVHNAIFQVGTQLGDY